MEAVKVTKLSELDKIIPMIQKLHKDSGIDKFISLTGFLAYISLKLPFASFNVWKAREGERIVGYAIAEITQRYFENECMIVDAYMESPDEELSGFMFNFIQDWAVSNGCTILSCHSHRAEALRRKYGFDSYGTVLMKRIGEKNNGGRKTDDDGDTEQS